MYEYGAGWYGTVWYGGFSDRIGTKTRAFRADNDAAYVVAAAAAASMATTTTIINAGAIVRVWAVNKNNCLLLHFAFRPFRQCVCMGTSVWVWVGSACVPAVKASTLWRSGLKFTHARSSCSCSLSGPSLPFCNKWLLLRRLCIPSKRWIDGYIKFLKRYLNGNKKNVENIGEVTFLNINFTLLNGIYINTI